MTSLRAARATLRKDLLVVASHRGRLPLAAVGIVVTLLVLSGNARFIGDAMSERLPYTQGGYLAFLVLGIAVFAFHDALVRELPARIRAARSEGTLEAMLGARGDLRDAAFTLALFPLVGTLTRVGSIVLLGSLAFDLELAWENLPLVLPVVATGALVFCGVGLLFAAAIIAGCRAEPVLALYGAFSGLLGGVFFPVEVLPGWIASLGVLVPVGHVLGPIRHALQGGDIAIGEDLLTLALLATIILPLALLALRHALARALRDGTLTR